jgi:hypothetical protein
MCVWFSVRTRGPATTVIRLRARLSRLGIKVPASMKPKAVVSLQKRLGFGIGSVRTEVKLYGAYYYDKFLNYNWRCVTVGPATRRAS